ncbi:hypothetical protein [Clostridium sp. UBA7791]|uniref:hypothetical protein n=1 Tax=Clostridium sp. UBA7791 TaxID=1946379 RepID=UPI0032170019
MKVRKYYHHVYTFINEVDWKKYWNDIEVFRSEFGEDNIVYYSGDDHGFITCDIEVNI